MAIQGREFSPTHYRSASSAYTCVANRVVRVARQVVRRHADGGRQGVLRIVSCGCKTGCPKTCGWRKAGCVANRVVRLQDRLSEDMWMAEGRVVLFTHVQSLKWTNMQQHSCASNQSRFRR